MFISETLCAEHRNADYFLWGTYYVVEVTGISQVIIGVMSVTAGEGVGEFNRNV